MTLFVFIVLSAGVLLLRLAGVNEMPTAAAWVLGIFATAVSAYTLVVCLDMLAVTAFAILGVLLGGLALFLRGSASSGVEDTRPAASDLSGLLLCGLATVLWCRDMAEVPQFLAHEGLLTTWTDQFIHGSVISQFGDPRAAGHRAIQTADLPLPSYHYASYVLPAIFAAPLDVPGLTLATSVWVPLGFITLCAGAYALGHSLAGATGAVAALAALTLLPDAASYGLHNRLFGYHWHVVAVPGAPYAIGGGLLAITFLRRWANGQDVRPLLVSAALVAALLPIRLHIFALVLPAWLACAALCTRFVQQRKLAFAGVAITAFAVFVLSFYALFPHSRHALEPFLDIAHNHHLPIPYAGLYQELTIRYGAVVAVPIGVLLVFPASLGVLCFFYPVSVLVAKRSRGLEPIDWMPAMYLICYLLLIISAPVPAYGDATELTHRPFVALYAVVTVWTAAGFATWITAHGGLRVRRVRLSLIVLAAVSVLLVLRYTARDARWSYGYRVAEGLPRAASFLRSNWRPGDVLAAQGLKLGLHTADLAIQLVSLTGMPAYLALPHMQVSRGGAHKQAALERYSALEEISRADNPAVAFNRLRSLGIRWYVVAETDYQGPRWDPERKKATWVEGMVAVYSVGLRP
jgi:hypothetical protein